MREDRRRRYDDGFRREALELIKSGAGKDTLASRLAIPVYTARNWIRLYRSNGEEAVMGGGGSRRYDWETKVAASRDHVENGLTKTEAMARHGIASIAYLKRWCRDYRSGGAQAETQGQAERREIQTEARTDARAGARRTGRVPEGEGRVPGKTPGPAGVQVTRRERSAVVRLLAGRGHRLDHLLRIAGLPKSNVLSPPVAPGARVQAGRGADGTGDMGAHPERVRPPAGAHAPGPRVRHAHIRQDRAQGHAPYGAEMRHPLQEPVETLQLVQGRDGRPRA